VSFITSQLTRRLVDKIYPINRLKVPFDICNGNERVTTKWLLFPVEQSSFKLKIYSMKTVIEIKMIFVAMLLMVVYITTTSASLMDMQNVLRRLTGSNCVLIEDGRVPPYYTCLGCIIEEATGCVDDMRLNISANVGSGCDMSIVTESYNTACCPSFGINIQNRLDLMYVGSAYPQALRCIEAVGCKDSVIYEALLTECEAVCPPDTHKDQTGVGEACLANFNGAFSSYQLGIFNAVACVAGIIFMVIM
jgi:hypothetical protein